MHFQDDGGGKGKKSAGKKGKKDKKDKKDKKGKKGGKDEEVRIEIKLSVILLWNMCIGINI